MGERRFGDEQLHIHYRTLLFGFFILQKALHRSIAVVSSVIMTSYN